MVDSANSEITELGTPGKIFAGTRAAIAQRDLSDPVVVGLLAIEIATAEGWQRSRRLTLVTAREIEALTRFGAASVPLVDAASRLVLASDAEAEPETICAALEDVCNAARLFMGRFQCAS